MIKIFSRLPLTNLPAAFFTNAPSASSLIMYSYLLDTAPSGNGSPSTDFAPIGLM